jgi:hypothetical protein
MQVREIESERTWNVAANLARLQIATRNWKRYAWKGRGKLIRDDERTVVPLFCFLSYKVLISEQGAIYELLGSSLRVNTYIQIISTS